MESPLRRITNTTEEGINTNPALSGDGRFVAFESTEDIAGAGGNEGFRAIRANVEVNPASFAQMGAARAPAPAISQDGSRIAFASKDNPLGTNNDANSEIFLYDDARLIQVTNTSPGEISNRVVNGNFQPSISDDGRFIAFSSNRDLANQNADGNLEIVVYDSVALSFTQLTNSSGIVGASDAKISGNGASVAYIHDTGTTPVTNRDLLLQSRVGPPSICVLASNVPLLAMTYGRAISDDGARVVWSAETATNSTQVFLYDGRNNLTRQITSLGTRATDVALQATISGDGSRIAFATRRSFLGNTDGGVDLYTFDISTGVFGRITSGPSSATAEVVSSLNDDGSVIAFNFPRVLSGPVSRDIFVNDSEIYLSGTPARPAFSSLTVLNRGSFGHEPSTVKAVAPDSIAVALGGVLAFTTQQSKRQSDGPFPTSVGGTTVTVNGQPAQIFFVSPTEVHFHVPAATVLGSAEVVVTNSDGFQSRGTVTTLRSAPGMFTKSGDGLGEGMTLNADTLQPGPFDPSSGELRLIIFATGVRNGATVSVTAGGRALNLESIVSSPNMPGLDEVHVLVPADLRGSGLVDLVIRADARDSNPTTIEFIGDARRDLLINEFLADPPDSATDPTVGDANHDGVRSPSDDEFVELVNTTTHDIDVSGYQILTRGATGTNDVVRFTFAPDTIMPACTAAVVFGGGTFNSANPAFGGAQVFKPSSGSLSLTNTGGVITLRDQTGAIVNLVTYGGTTGFNANAGQSLTRSPDLTGSFKLHQFASGSGGRLFSPGTQLNGAAFSSCTPAIARVEVSPPAVTIDIGAQQQFTAHAFDAANNQVPGVIFSWQSSDTNVATIDQNGLATGVNTGSTEIRATGRGVQSAPANLTVQQSPPVLTSVTISPLTATIAVSETQQFTGQAKDQFGQNIGGITISFVSNNTTVATVDFVSPNSSTGSATATVTGRANGSAEVRVSATNGTTTVNSSPATLVVEPGTSQLLISEFRTRGPGGAADEFVEIYNPTTSSLTIGGLKIRASNGSGTISDRITITAGATLGPGCHYLLANSSSGGFSGSLPADQTYGNGITDDGGIAITGSNGTRIIDAVGMSNTSAYKEGTPLVPLIGNLDQSYERKPGDTFGNGIDTNNNAGDFASTVPSNPKNSSSGCLDTSSADLSITKADSPDPVTIGSDVTYTITVTNNGVAVAQNVTVTDDLPPEVTFVSCSSTGGGVCGGSGNNRTVTFSSLPSGSSVTVTLVVTANGPVGTTISNTATVISATQDSDSGNNSATAPTLVQAPLPGLSINEVAANEGDGATTTFSFTVSLSAPAPGAGVRFDIGTQDNTATATSGDYVSRSLTNQTIPSGQQTYTFDVTVNGDTLVESNEIFFVNVTNVTSAAVSDRQGQGTIQNDDTANLVISQVYGGGGNTGALFTNDFVEIFNRGMTTVNFAATPYSVQYAGATASFGSSKVDLSSGTIVPGEYFLIQLSGGANGAPLPAPDASGSIAMAATAGKVALVAGTTALAGSGCPLPATVADFVGYGTTVDCFEGFGRGAAPGNTTADLRKGGGCTDTNDNAADFVVSAPFPRNTSSPLNNCVAGMPPNLTINDVTVTEGNAGTTTATFTVSLSAPAPSTDITFDIATQNNTATTANSDYVAKTLTNQLLPAGQQTYSFTVNVIGDTAVENNETFFVNVTNVSGATLVDGQGVGTIQNDDLPSLSINDVSQNEGNAGTAIFSFIVSLSAPAPTGGVTFDIATQDNTATVSDNDYVPRALASQTIPAGSSTYNFDVTVNGDLTIEANETFFVGVTNVSGTIVSDSQGVGIIQNDDSPTLTINDVSQSEGNSGITTFTFTVTSSLPAPAGGITFDISTADGTAQDNTPATEDHDYVARSLTGQTISAGNTTYTFEVTVNGDTLVESNETFFVNVTNVTEATVLDGQGQGTIQNNDTPLLVISQVYGGGGNASATYTRDFVEIFNRGTTTVDFSVTPYSVQYAAAASNFSTNKTDITSGVLLPGHYFLVQEASGGVVGVALPAPDATGAINLAATAGKVALVTGTTALTGSGCPFGATIADFLGYGSTANCFETAPIAVSGTNPNARSVIRTASCTDTNNNSADFSNPATAPVARNTATVPAPCP
ncbi:MAG TPA: lamin tail domain-containing protein [Pyrinomonadaceae bacterium]